ncbi:MAG: bifunctional acetate--CoA ligase family protein/GNAT family N-acetyltransferase [Anaerolineae bacterium]
MTELPKNVTAEPVVDPTHDLIYRGRGRKALDHIFNPRNVAVIGASERVGSVGRTILWNLISTPFGGTVFPVNPKRASVLGIRAYPSIKDVPEKVDLAVVVTPAPTVPAIIQDCADLGIPGAIIISAGFKEIGPEGAALEKQVLEIARKSSMRIIGPNCLGVMSPTTGLNATFAAGMARPGSIGFISQSGALCTAVLDWSLQENVGFSHFVSIGSMLDVNWGDLIYYLGDDPRTSAIVIYMETIGDARSFLSAAREVALTKPIIVIKPGRTEAAAKAAASHTGSLTGSDDVLEAAFQRSGVLRVNDIAELFAMAETLSKQPRPRGPRLTIVTNAGGPGVLATDALITSGGELTEISPETMEELNKILPPAWSHNNPIDVLGDAEPERYAKALEIAGHDPNADGLLVILTPQDMTDPTMTAEALKPYARIENKPVLASWMGGASIAAGEDILNRAGISTFEYPDAAARAFSYMWKYSENLQRLYQTPTFSVAGEENAPNRERVAEIIDAVRAEGRTILTEAESKEVLACYGIPTIPMKIAETAEEAVQAAEELGYPVVVKIHSETITHKTDVGGVKLNLKTADAVREAFNSIRDAVHQIASPEDFLGVSVQPMIKLDGYEVIIGSTIDPQFGPVMLFGTGGSLVEVYKDTALALPPLNSVLARQMMRKTRIYKALKGVRGQPPVDLVALEELLVRYSQMITEQKWIKETDINPLLASPEQLLALDARIVLFEPDVTEDQLPRLAIRPYPFQYAQPYATRSGEELLIRPIRPEDEPLVVEFHKSLSERTVYLRYLQQMNLNQRIAHDRLVRICFTDYDREIVLVAERNGGSNHAIVGVARLTRLHGTNDARFAMIVADEYQGQGLGAELLQRLIGVARDEKIERIVAFVSPDNKAMLRLFEKLNFAITEQPDENNLLYATLTL